jgi:hypothetical protein
VPPPGANDSSGASRRRADESAARPSVSSAFLFHSGPTGRGRAGRLFALRLLFVSSPPVRPSDFFSQKYRISFIAKMLPLAIRSLPPPHSLSSRPAAPAHPRDESDASVISDRRPPPPPPQGPCRSRTPLCWSNNGRPTDRRPLDLIHHDRAGQPAPTTTACATPMAVANQCFADESGRPAAVERSVDGALTATSGWRAGCRATCELETARIGVY